MNEEIQKIADRIAKGVRPERVVLFGSQAEGHANLNSDIDLCVIADRVGSRIDECVKIRKLIGDFILPMDVLVFSRQEYDKRKGIFGTVQYEVEKKGIVLYDRRD